MVCFGLGVVGQYSDRGPSPHGPSVPPSVRPYVRTSERRTKENPSDRPPTVRRKEASMVASLSGRWDPFHYTVNVLPQPGGRSVGRPAAPFTVLFILCPFSSRVSLISSICQLQQSMNATTVAARCVPMKTFVGVSFRASLRLCI